LSTPFDKTKAYELGIIDDKGNILRKRKELKTSEEKDAYTMLHTLVWKLKRILDKIPGVRTRLGTFATALWLIKEELNVDKVLIEEAFYAYMRKINPDVLVDIIIESNSKDSNNYIKKGVYEFKDNTLVLYEDLAPFETIIGVDLYTHNEHIFTKYDIQRK
jgi:hypothetical protein